MGALAYPARVGITGSSPRIAGLRVTRPSPLTPAPCHPLRMPAAPQDPHLAPPGSDLGTQERKERAQPASERAKTG